MLSEGPSVFFIDLNTYLIKQIILYSILSFPTGPSDQNSQTIADYVLTSNLLLVNGQFNSESNDYPNRSLVVNG